MRLWQKISIVCISILLAVVTATSALLLVSSRNSILDLTVTNAKEKQTSLAKSFANMTQYAIGEGMDEQTKRDELLACFATYADETSVLVQGTSSLYSFVDMEPQDILPLTTADQRVFLDEVGSRNLLIVGSRVTLGADAAPYAVYIVRDISGVYKSYDRMAMQFLIIAAVGILVGMLLIAILVRAESGPLKALSITARRIAGGEYGERANIHTHDEVGELADDFNRMAEAVQTHVYALEERNTAQELFISGLTHEFKTPMTSMMLHSETLMSMDLPPELQKKSLSHIYEQCRWLERLTQKLLSLITLGQGLTPTENDVSALFDRVASCTAETLSKRGTPLVTVCEGAETLPFDPDLLQSLLVNLVDNASKASEPGQEIRLACSGRTLSVSDHGRGIPADAVARVTEPFYMVDKSRSKKQGGSGLGLALVKRIADAHHAKLVIDTALGEGTTISVVFP